MPANGNGRRGPLSDELALEIIEAMRFYMTRVPRGPTGTPHPESGDSIARRYGISSSTVLDIIHGRRHWAPELIARRMLSPPPADLPEPRKVRQPMISARAHLQQLRKRRRDKKYGEGKRRRSAEQRPHA